MSVTSHLQELRKKHAVLANRVEQEQRTPSADPVQISEMKRQKLRLKEEIERLAAH